MDGGNGHFFTMQRNALIGHVRAKPLSLIWILAKFLRWDVTRFSKKDFLWHVKRWFYKRRTAVILIYHMRIFIIIDIQYMSFFYFYLKKNLYSNPSLKNIIFLQSYTSWRFINCKTWISKITLIFLTSAKTIRNFNFYLKLAKNMLHVKIRLYNSSKKRPTSKELLLKLNLLKVLNFNNNFKDYSEIINVRIFTIR